MENLEKKTKHNQNIFTYGLGTVGRDMVYTIVSMYLMFYLTDILNLNTNVLWWITTIILVARIFDAFNDPIMGMIVDNTHSKYGRFKPWILAGVLISSVFTILLFTDFHLSGALYVVVFGVIYLCWGMSYTMNDISYWSMLPTLSKNQKEREKIGSVARICANIGLFSVVSLIVPITTWLGEKMGSMQKAYFIFALAVVIIMISFQMITIFGVKEDKSFVNSKNQHTSLKEMFRVIFQNDQLFVTGISLSLFMIGYMTTTSFGLYYFKYAYGNEGMYSVFAVVLGVSQLAALVIFPLLSKKFSRKILYTFSTILVVAGYVLFFFAPVSTFIFIGIAGVMIFVGEAFIQLMMLMFLTDSVEYGEWKFHKRNDSVSLSLQPFINKMGGAVASGITGAVVIISGMKDASSAADMTSEGLLILKIAMLILPLICILAGFIVWKAKYILDDKMYNKIIEENNQRKNSEIC